jgi:formate hydrogenlyase transcriptional activator
MATTFDGLAEPLQEDATLNQPGSLLAGGGEIESFASDHRCTGGGMSDWRIALGLLKSLSELMVGFPALVEVEALRVWPYPPENCAIRTNLMMADLSVELGVGMELPPSDAIVAWIRRHQRPLIIAPEEDARFPDFARLLRARGIKHFCAIPLIFAHRPIAVLGLFSTRREAFSRSDVEFVQRGMSGTGSATGNDGRLHHAPETEENSHGEEVCLEAEGSSEASFEGIIGRSAAMHAVRDQVKIIAPTGSTVLILGETGTGKELIARAIHNLSPRHDRPFIKVNCAAIPVGLIESELFGHERGAFTGAIGRRIGRFEMAHGGTLFLDEVGDIPLELQPKLLRVLQEQEFERVGSSQTTRVDVRIVAATSRDLPRMVAAREFRPDLYYRLNVFLLRVAALREHSEDIPPLVRHFVRHYSAKANKQIAEIPVEAIRALTRHRWPGNVRELQNVVERAVILSAGKILRPSLDELQPSSPTNDLLGADKGDDLATLKNVEREHIIRALAATNWVVGGPKGAAARIGLQRTTLIAKMQKLGITRAQA